MTPTKNPANGPIDAVYTPADATVFDMLRLSLRSLDRYAPWIRKVHLVTDAPAPRWLDRDETRISMFRHEDIVRGRGGAPESNPDAITWQLFHIPGISRQFLYLDVNCFLGRRLARDEFLTPGGGHRFFVDPADLAPGGAAESLLNSRFGNRSPRKKPGRTPRFLDRSFLEEVNRLWEKPIRQGAVSLETLYFGYLLECPQQYGVHEQTVITPKIYREASISSSKEVAAILTSRPQFFCLDGTARGKSLPALLKLFYWRKSAFEK